MADANPQVMEMVRSELEKNPDTSNQELLEKAKKIDRSVGDLSPRQFNAIYPLQVKRRQKPRKRAGRARAGAAKGGRGRKRGREGAAAAAAGADREQVRKVLVQLARDVAQGDRGALVEVVAGIDRYVDRVMKAAS